jgi:hypothetical protein
VSSEPAQAEERIEAIKIAIAQPTLQAETVPAGRRAAGMQRSWACIRRPQRMGRGPKRPIRFTTTGYLPAGCLGVQIGMQTRGLLDAGKHRPKTPVVSSVMVAAGVDSELDAAVSWTAEIPRSEA